MFDLFWTLLEIYKWVCTVGVSAIVLLGLLVWLAFGDEIKAEDRRTAFGEG